MFVELKKDVLIDVEQIKMFAKKNSTHIGVMMGNGIGLPVDYDTEEECTQAFARLCEAVGRPLA